jgi:DNA-binding MarR family transcriptional regulator
LRQEAEDRNGTLYDQNRERRKHVLRDYFAAHGTFPSLATLAALWGYASKSTAAREVGILAEQGFVISTDGPLRPGPAFGGDHAQAVDRAEAEWTALYGEPAAKVYVTVSRLLGLARTIEARIAASAEVVGLALGEFLILDALHRMGPPHECAPSELGRKFLITPAGIGKRVDRLVAAGLVERVRARADGRSLLVRLTDAGLTLVRTRMSADMAADHFTWIMRLGEQDLALFNRILEDAQTAIDAS